MLCELYRVLDRSNNSWTFFSAEHRRRQQKNEQIVEVRYCAVGDCLCENMNAYSSFYCRAITFVVVVVGVFVCV